ncbi:hypothetical protein ACC778_32900 [Rhizobium ruizarguesonis]
MFHELQPVHMLLKPKDEWIQSRNEEPSTGSKMSLMRKYTYDELAALRDSQGPVITVEYEECGRSGELDRKKLVKQYGASVICPASTKTGARLQQYEL